MTIKNNNGLEAPCLGCTDRVVGCHSTCEKYLEYEKKNMELREEKYRQIDKYQKTMTINHEKRRRKNTRCNNG